MRLTPYMLLLSAGCTPLPELAFNEPPGAPTVHVDPAAPTTTDGLSGVLDIPAEDGEGDTLSYEWSWYLDDVLTLSGTRLVDPASTAKGQHWEVVAIATDGEFTGEEARATVTIANSAPVLDSLDVEPLAPRTDEDIELSVAGSDADGDPVTWHVLWSRDGEELTGYSGELTVPAAATSSGETWTATVKPFDGTTEGAADTLSVYIDNTPPVLTALRVLPTAPAVDDAIAATVTVEDPDRDSQTVSVEFTWYVDGVEVYSVVETDGSSYLTEGFVKGDSVTVTAIPTDGFASGEAWTSDPVTVVNSAPVLDSVSISPTSGYESTTFECIPGTATDVDGDRVTYGYAWYVDGSHISASGSTLSGSSFSRNQEIYCVVTPDDGDEDGASVTSATVEVLNSVPTITGVAITPTSPTVSTQLTASVTGGTDADGDSISYTYAWTVNGTSIGASTSTLNNTLFARGDEVQVRVTPSDSGGSGTAITSSAVEIQNAIPTVGSASISPSSPRTADTLTVSTSGGNDADGDTVTYTYQWYLAGVAISGEVGSSISSASTTKGDRYTCVVTPYDGIDYGTTRTTSAVTIGNTTPVADADATTGLTANECDVIVLDASGSTDADEDPLTYSWTLSSKPSGSQTSTSNIDARTDEQPDFMVDYAGTFTFSLSASDGSQTATDTVNITVYDAAGNVAPVAVPDSDTDTLNETTACSSSGSGFVCTPCMGTFDLEATPSYDDDDDPLYYSWSTSSGYATLSSSTAESTTVTMRNMPTTHLTTTTYQATITLRVQDCAGNSDTENVVLTYNCTGN